MRLLAHGCRSRMRAGFTLIEVLVVVALIALLAAILLPSLAQSRRQAQSVACLSNMRQLGMALQMYAQTHGNRIVSGGLSHGGVPSPPDAAARSWFHTMDREYGNHLVARCPSDDSPYWDSPLPGTDPPIRRRVSYAINDYLTGALDGWEEFNLIQRIRRTATTIAFVELAGDTPWAVGDHVHVELWLLNPRLEARRQMALDRHLGRSNYVFVDGHAATHTFEQTYQLRNIRRVDGRLVPEWAHNMYDPRVGY